MFTPDFRKAFLALGAVATAILSYAVIISTFTALSVWAERDVGAHPFKQEDWLRYLLSARLTGSTDGRIMLLGPSTVRENLRFEQFEEAFPGASIFQGGISLGTVEDATTALKYVEKAYGAEALPEIVVLGVSPRFIANIPEERPFRQGIDRYSPRFRIVEIGTDYELTPKSLLEGLVSALRFLNSKEPERFRITLYAVAYRWLTRAPALVEGIDRVLAFPQAPVSARAYDRTTGRDNSIIAKLENRISPYKYARNNPWRPEKLSLLLNKPATETWWARVFAWNAESDAVAPLRLKELMDFINRRQIRLLVINMPEREVARNLYKTDYQNYLDLVLAGIDGAAFVDLREYLTTDEFYDAEHSTPEGSRRLTGEVINLLKMLIEDGEICEPHKAYVCTEES